MALLPSFGSELIAFRKRLVTHQAELPKEQRGQYALAIKILDDWQAAGDREKLWKKLRLKLRCTPSEFIYQILHGRYMAEELAQRLARLPELESATQARAKHLVERKQWGDSAVVTMHAQRLQIARSKFSRETGTVARNAFSKELSRVFQERCGRSLDWAVAALTAIVFDDERVTPEAVRKARKNRTTDPAK